MLAAHMDSIGLMVSDIVDGYLRVTEIGGLDARVLPGQPVTVHGQRELAGLLVQPPPHSLPQDGRKGPVALEHLLVEVGLSERQVDRLVRPGDLISFRQEPIDLQGDRVAGHSLDNRASLAALTVCLRELQRREHSWDVVAVATTQEEETMVGALTSAYQLQPSLAVAVDVTWARGPGLPEHRTFPVGEGPTNGWGPNIHPGVHEALKQAANRVEIPLTKEILPKHSGTDAYAMQVAREGIPTGLVSIPLKYMHTPVEVISMKDVERAGRLLAEFACGLDADFMSGLTWD
jgi:endoglucanase